MKSKLKNLILKLISVVLLIGFFILILILFNFNKKSEKSSIFYYENVKKGQVWVKTDSINPFKPVTVDTVVVLDVKKDYSLVVVNRDTLSIPSRWVTTDSKQIK